MELNEKNFLNSLKNLFPTRFSFIVFISYMGLFINQGILVTATKDKYNKFNYNPITVVLLTELVKLILSSTIYIKKNSFDKMWIEIFKNKSTFIKYFIPSFLYCLYNNLTFVNLRSYDPTTYFLLLQFRVVLTAIIFQILFSKKLTRLQWISIILLTFGCILKHVGYSNNSKSLSSTRLNLNDYFNSSLILIGFQILSSCIAGVYNEYLLKKDESADIMLQNFFMYVDSIVCNIFLLSLNVPNDENSSGLIEAFSIKSLYLIFNIKVVLIILNNAAIGLVTSLFLKNLNSILKTFASALELVFTAILSLIIFKIPLDSMTIFSIAIVSFATWLYSKNPVINVIKQQNHVDITNKQNPTDFSTNKLISNV